MHQDKLFAGLPPASDGMSADHSRLCAERDIVMASADFARAPIMKRLLDYLIDETIAGRGDQLKAYSVAVDGLGRAPDYDARADSYPRVQVGRLRRMLAGHYQRHPSTDGQGLVIPTGRYRVGIAPYLPDTQPEVPPTPDQPAPAPRIRPVAAVLLIIAIAIAGAAIAWLLPGGWHATVQGRSRPMLELTTGPIEGVDPNLRNLIRGSLLDGLRRSTMFDIRMVRRTPAASPQPSAQYRLATELVSGARPHLFLRLWRLNPDRILWSSTITLPRDAVDGGTIANVLAPAISAIGRVDGLIATHELRAIRSAEPSSYQCLLLYHRYRRERVADERPAIERCVGQGLATDPDNAALHAAAANLALTRIAPRSDALPGLLDTAQRHAQLATSIDPLNAWANAAQAHVAVLRKACPQAINDAARTFELDPFDPVLIADAGLDMLACGDERAEMLIRRAIALDDGPEGRFYAPLVLVAVERGDQALARDALGRMAAPVIGRHPRFYLFSAAGYAMIGDRERAKAAWTKLVATDARIARNPGAYLARIGLPLSLRSKTLGLLRDMGFVAA